MMMLLLLDLSAMWGADELEMIEEGFVADLLISNLVCLSWFMLCSL